MNANTEILSIDGYYDETQRAIASPQLSNSQSQKVTASQSGNAAEMLHECCTQDLDQGKQPRHDQREPRRFGESLCQRSVSA
jgi:hypothetical protein